MTTTPKTSLVKLLAQLPGSIIPVFRGFERDVSDVPADSPHSYPLHRHIMPAAVDVGASLYFTSEAYRNYRIREAFRGPDNGSYETMEVYELPEALEQTLY